MTYEEMARLKVGARLFALVAEKVPARRVNANGGLIKKLKPKLKWRIKEYEVERITPSRKTVGLRDPNEKIRGNGLTATRFSVAPWQLQQSYFLTPTGCVQKRLDVARRDLKHHEESLAQARKDVEAAYALAESLGITLPRYVHEVTP